MKWLTLLFSALVCTFDSTTAQGILGTILSEGRNTVSNILSIDPCIRDHTREFQKSLTAFSTDLFKRASEVSGNHFVISPYSIWLTLAVIAEGADDITKQEYFSILHLPKEFCARKEYYRIALGLEPQGSDVKLSRKRVMVFGNDLRLNPKWVDFVRDMDLLELTTAAKNASVGQITDLNGTSLILDTLDYDGFWTTAFPSADIKRSAFYDDDGKHIGMVDLMRTKTRVRLAHLPFFSAKVLELPVGNNGRYTMLITMGLDNVRMRRLFELYQSSFVVEILNNLIMSLVPLEIAIPKFTVMTKYDARKILEDIGLKSIWNNPAATKYISDPAPIPKAFMQQVKVNIGSAGITQPPNSGASNIFTQIWEATSNAATGLAAAVGRNFIANKPFLYTLIDAKTNTILFTGAYSKPEN